MVKFLTVSGAISGSNLIFIFPKFVVIKPSGIPNIFHFILRIFGNVNYFKNKFIYSFLSFKSLPTKQSYIDQLKTIFVNRTNQTTIIKEAINSFLDNGVTDKHDIYTKVVDELGVPRPTVRRVARDLRNELLAKIRVLQSETQQTTVPSV